MRGERPGRARLARLIACITAIAVAIVNAMTATQMLAIVRRRVLSPLVAATSYAPTVIAVGRKSYVVIVHLARRAAPGSAAGPLPLQALSTRYAARRAAWPPSCDGQCRNTRCM